MLDESTLHTFSITPWYPVRNRYNLLMYCREIQIQEDSLIYSYQNAQSVVLFFIQSKAVLIIFVLYKIIIK